MLPEKSVSPTAKEDIEMRRNCNENRTAMKVPLSTCFAALRKGVDGNNANDGYDKVGVVPGRKNCSPDSIQDFEHHIPLFRKASGRPVDLENSLPAFQLVACPSVATELFKA